MTCQTVRERLLGCERPDHPPADEAGHLAGCAGCRAWLRRLVRLEQMLPLVPVPASPPPAALLALLQAAPPEAIVTTPACLRPSPILRREGGRQKLALALALAATLALFALAWWAWPPTSSSRPETRIPLRELVDKRLKQAPTSALRVAALADVADEFLSKTRTHGNDPRQVAELAAQFHRIVKDDLPWHAKDVSHGERAEVLKLAGRFNEMSLTATRLAKQWETRHRASAASLRQIAADAREADRELRRLIEA